MKKNVLKGPKPAPEMGTVAPPPKGEKPEVTRIFALEEWEGLALKPANENRHRARALAQTATQEHQAAEEQFGDLLTKVIDRINKKFDLKIPADGTRNFNFKKGEISCVLPPEEKS